MKRPTSWLLPAVLSMAVTGTGCDRGVADEIRVQRVPKAPAAATDAAEPAAAQPVAAQRGEEIQWAVPATWKRLPAGQEQLRYATFRVSETNPNAIVTVVPLGGEAGSLLDNVRRWQNQLGLKPAEQADLGKVTAEVETAGAGKATIVDLRPESPEKLAMLAAIVRHDDTTWFYKLTGPADLVSQERGNFEAFTKSTTFAAGLGQQPQQVADGAGDTPPLPAGHPALPGQPAGNGQQTPPLPAGHPALPGQAGGQPQLPSGHPALPGQEPGAAGSQAAEGAPIKMKTPDGWTLQAARPMRDATYSIGADEKRAEVVVSHFPQGVGDFLSNVNRWRGQVGLPPIEKADPNSLGESVKVGSIDARLFDFAAPESSKPRLRQMVAVCNNAGSDWFFKIIGPADAVESNKQAFVQFLSSVRLGD